MLFEKSTVAHLNFQQIERGGFRLHFKEKVLSCLTSARF